MCFSTRHDILTDIILISKYEFEEYNGMERNDMIFKQTDCGVSMKAGARKVNRNTDIANSSGVVLCLPANQGIPDLFTALKKKIDRYNRNTTVLNDPEPSFVDFSKPIILIGNLSDSHIVKNLYFRFLTATDLWYPGPGGYEIRTLLDPYGKGGNIIHIGYSDEDGLRKALLRFLPEITKTIGQMIEIKPNRLHICKSEEKHIRAIQPPELVWMNVARDIYKKGYLGYLTGDWDLINAYADMWRAIVGYPIVKDDQKIKDLHLKMSNLIQSFRLMETSGLMVDDELRGKIAEYIINWPVTDQGTVRIDKGDYMHPEYPRQNHGMIPSLGLAYLLDYCRTYSYEMDDEEGWQRLVDKAYQPYMSGSWKPVCDGTCHGWYLSQPALLEYGLIDPSHSYFESGGARKAAEAAIDLVNNSGTMPSSGDSNLLRSFPGIILRHAMAYYNDGRYKYVHDLAPAHMSSGYHVYMPRMFDAGIEAKLPDDKTGICITPMDPLIYNSWEKAPELVREMLETGPDVPIESAFDKLSIRTGWAHNDQYLLVDGLGNNSNHSHSYPNALGIVDYFHKGESWIVEENGSKFPEPENLSILTIYKKGGDFKIPSFGELIETKSDSAEYTAVMRLNNYQGTQWTREVVLIHGMGLIIKDRVDIAEDGEFHIMSHLRTPGEAGIEGNGLVASRNGHSLSVKAYCSSDFTIGKHSNDMTLTYRNHKGEPAPIVPELDMEKTWQNRYHTADRIITSLDTGVSGSFDKGETIEFVHIVSVDGGMDDVSIDLPAGRCTPVNASGYTQSNPEKEILEKILGDEVHSCDILDEGDSRYYFAGHGKRSISCIDSDLNLVWTREIDREPTYCYWWELDYPAAVSIKAFIHRGNKYLVVGCGDLFVRCLDEKGDERWRFQYINGVPGRINVFDSDGDGVPEILVGGEIISNRSQLRVLGLNGVLKYELDAEFWTSRLTAYADLISGNERFVALGANRGRNLHLYRTYKDGDSRPVKILEKKLSGAIDDIVLDGGKRLVMAHSSDGYWFEAEF